MFPNSSFATTVNIELCPIVIELGWASVDYKSDAGPTTIFAFDDWIFPVSKLTITSIVYEPLTVCM